MQFSNNRFVLASLLAGSGLVVLGQADAVQLGQRRPSGQVAGYNEARRSQVRSGQYRKDQRGSDKDT